MDGQLVTIRSVRGAPTIEELVRQYHLRGDDIDVNFGVVAVDPDDHLYAVRIKPAAAFRLIGQSADISGPYADPEIGAFGLRK